jgi:hypothetical protein
MRNEANRRILVYECIPPSAAPHPAEWSREQVIEALDALDNARLKDGYGLVVAIKHKGHWITDQSISAEKT